jgi:hypothetical protein
MLDYKEMANPTYQVRLTEAEMQWMCKALAAYLNMLAAEKRAPSTEMSLHLMSSMTKMREATVKGPNILLLGDQ